MAYNDDAVLSKLSALNESHDSIATAAQWIMFHRRHAQRTVQLWLTKLKDLPSHKRLNLVYLANEVVQQSKARHKEDFLREFSPIIPEATAVAYKGASSDIQAKLRRVIDVWKDRNIFEPPVQEEIESRLQELDRARSTAKVGGFSGSLFNSPAPSVPSELDPLLAPQQIVSRVQHSAASAIKTANAEYDKIVDPAAAVPAPPVYAARLNGLMKSLASAEGAVAECVKARKELVGALERMLQSNREALEMEEAQLEQLGAQKTKIEIKKQEVEVAIIRDMSNSDKEHAPVQAGNDLQEPERPQMEALTPPHVQDHQGDDGNTAPSNGLGPHAGPAESSGLPQQLAFPSAPGIEMLSNLASQYHAVPVNGSNKKRKIDASEEFPDLGGDDGMDADVAEMIRRESRGNQSWA